MRLLDLFCGAGGCSVGYHRAGFTEIVGVDVAPQKNYPFTFIQGEAIGVMEALLSCGGIEDGAGGMYLLSDFDAIHASPPCQAYSVTKNMGHTSRKHPDLVDPVRKKLEASRLPWVMENVPGAPLVNPVCVCGLALGLQVKRHRLFESNRFLFGTTCPRGHRSEWVTVCGGGAPAVADARRRASADRAREAMGIDWMTRDELAQAIPPAYTEFIGRQLLDWIAK